MRKISAILFMLIAVQISAQQPKQLSSSAIYHEMKKLKVLGNVLYLAAHPDDENTRFIAYCANEKRLNTAYLALTRGDGGQNLIGPEIREELGIIRTQELLAARRTDGGKQYFSRANDFGYSKTPEETFEIWDKEKILSDVVWVIRKFRPDVIVCRFPTDGKGGHGHHTASALLGVEAFEKAADQTQFPEQLQFVETWQAKRFVVNTGRWWNPEISADDPGVVAEDIGKYNPLLGTSYNELAAVSRTMHKSQGFGTVGERGEQFEYFEHLKGDQAQASLFENIDFSWKRISQNEQDTLPQLLDNMIDQLLSDFDEGHPENSINALLSLRMSLQKISDHSWRRSKVDAVDELIKQCGGLYLEAVANDYWAVKGDSVYVDFEVISRNLKGLKLERIVMMQQQDIKLLGSDLAINQKLNLKLGYQLHKIPLNQPYWLDQEGTLGTYRVDDQLSIGLAENFPAVSFVLGFTLNGVELNYAVPLVYKWKDPVKGERYRPFVMLPPVVANFDEETQLFSELKERSISVTVKAMTANVQSKLSLKVPNGWVLSKTSFDLTFTKKGEEQKVKLTLKPTATAELGNLSASLQVQDQVFNQSLKSIIYDHIPSQVYLPEAKAQLVYVPIKKKGNKIGYLDGAGDVIPEALTGIGYTVDQLEEADLTLENLKQYDAVILGIRAVNVNDRIEFMMPKLLRYCENGGNLILQYNTAHRLKTENFAPYPLKLSRDRVTEEDAAVTFLKPEHPVLNTPNKLTMNDFNDWVQERGLYFPNEWDAKYEAILSWHDQGEEAKNGSLLIAKYGKGYYVYTGISFFRELPAGVPGAYRLLVNIISLGHE